MTRKEKNRAEAKALALKLAKLTSQEALSEFVVAGGSGRFTSGTYEARFRGLATTCTAGPEMAVKAWIARALS